MRSKFLISVVVGFWALFCFGCYLVGCGNDRISNSPVKEPEYHLVADLYAPDSNHADHNYYLMTISTQSDSIVDSLPAPDIIQGISFSNDGLMAGFTINIPEPAQIQVTNWPMSDTLAIYEGLGGGNLSFSADNQYILGTMGRPALLTFPEMELKYTNSAGCFNAVFIPNRTLFCYNIWFVDSIYYVDYGIDPPFSYAIPLIGKSGEALDIDAFCASNSGDSLILATSASDGRYIVVATTDSLKVLDQVKAGPMFWFTHPVIHPDGDRVYWYFEGGSWPSTVPGTIFCYDIPAKEFKTIVDQSSFGLFFPSDIVITPDGRYLYFYDAFTQGIFKVDLTDYQVTRILAEHRAFAESIAINPRNVVYDK